MEEKLKNAPGGQEQKDVEITAKLQELSVPLIKLLSDNYNPHCHIVVSMDRVKIISDELQLIINRDVIN